MNISIDFGYEYLDNNFISLNVWRELCRQISEITKDIVYKKQIQLHKYDMEKLIMIQKTKLKAFCSGGIDGHQFEGQLQILSCVTYKILEYLNGNIIDMKNVLNEMFGETIPCIIEIWYPMYETEINRFYNNLIN
jgi:hypothetical protein